VSTYDLVCIGSGPAGEKAATQAAYYGRRVAVVERAPRPGGAMVNTGTVPSKALRETALLLSAMRRCPIPGFEPRIDHSISVPRFMARRFLVEQQEHDRIEASFDRHGIEVFRGSGRFKDASAIEVVAQDGSVQTLQTRYSLIATGSSPVRPANIPFDHPRVVDADGILELQHIPRSLIIVGGGVIGCEYASVFNEIDVEVTIVHPRPDLLPFLDKDCRELLAARLRAEGIRLELSASVARVEALSAERLAVTTEDGRRLEADAVLWAAGRRANTDALNLGTVGVEVDTRGPIKVDENYRTTAATIYAAGDVIGFPALAATSMEQGRIAACHMFGIDFKKKIAATIPMGIYTIPGISSVGMTEEEAAKAGVDCVVGTASFRDNARARMLGDEHGMLKCVFDRATRRLIGATVLGEQATEIVHIAQFVIAADGTLDQFINACFNYPSLSEMYKYAAYSALHKLNHGTRSIGGLTSDDEAQAAA